jgi:peptide/nickel transport system permease protein
LLLYSVPEFWFALMLLFVFAHRLHVLPATGMIDAAMYDTMTPFEQVRDRLRHIVLPWTALTVMGTAVFARYQRAAMRETVGEPFMRTARAKGLSEGAARRQAWRVAMPPVITVAGLFFPALLTGAVFVERVFGWPGMGTALLDAISRRDYELVSACVIIGSATTAIGTLLADIVRAVVDPRLRHG